MIPDLEQLRIEAEAFAADFEPRVIPTAYNKYLAVTPRDSSVSGIGVIGDTIEDAIRKYREAIARHWLIGKHPATTNPTWWKPEWRLDALAEEVGK